MLSVGKMWEGVRQEGVNYGLPVMFIQLGPGAEYTSEDLVKEVLVHTRCRWCCITGQNTTQVGMGTLVKGLSSVGMSIEVEVDGSIKDPGWLHTIDRWVVDYAKEGLFNYGALRSQDMIRFVIKGEGDLNFAKEGFEDLKLFPGTKYLMVIPEDIIPRSGDKALVKVVLLREAFQLVRRYDRCRLYW